jgi:hypothetical protein
MNSLTRTLIVLILILGFQGIGLPFADACPGCTEREGSDDGAAAAAGTDAEVDILANELYTPYAYNSSVYFMLAMPFMLVAGFGTAFYLMVRKQRQVRETAGRWDLDSDVVNDPDR